MQTKEQKSEYARKWYQLNKERVVETGKNYREANKEKIAERQRKYNEANKEKIAKTGKNYREANKEITAARHRQYNEANKEKIAKTNRQYYETHLNNTIYLFELPNSKMYVGSTRRLDYRLSLHKRHLNEYPERTLYQAIQESGGWNSVKIHILMHDIPTKELRLQLEQFFINKIPNQLRLNDRSAVSLTR
jgi:hypothetical protein